MREDLESIDDILYQSLLFLEYLFQTLSLTKHFGSFEEEDFAEEDFDVLEKIKDKAERIAEWSNDSILLLMIDKK